MINYDIIGDIHGHADELEKLLQKLGYKKNNNIYKHPDKRKVIFLGDYIDRGPKIRETLHLVKNMCDAGTAEAIMGNHEYNAVCFVTPNKEEGGFYRKHTIIEINQHYETLKQFKDYKKEWEMFLNWFKTLPLFLEKETFITVHACWDTNHIQWLKNNYSGKLTPKFLQESSKTNSTAFIAIEETLKGKEIKLPGEHFIIDKDKNKRKNSRLKWWQPLNKRIKNKDILLPSPEKLENKTVFKEDTYYYNGEKPVFFGHYWLKGNPTVENKKAICLDYSVAKKGKLVAFRSEYLNFEKNINQGFVY